MIGTYYNAYDPCFTPMRSNFFNPTNKLFSMFITKIIFFHDSLCEKKGGVVVGEIRVCVLPS